VESLSRLDGKQFNGYRVVRLPHALDAVVESVVTAYVDGSAPVRRRMSETASPRAASALIAYGERMAAVAVRTQSQQPLRRALVAMGLAYGRLDDQRDTLYPLVAVNHSAGLLDTELSRLIDAVADYLPDAAVTAFRAFVNRDEADKSLRCMGLGTTGSNADFRYISATTAG
jgi:hypothetical protein